MDLVKKIQKRVESFNKTLYDAIAEIGDNHSFIDEYGDMLAILPMKIKDNELVVTSGYIEAGEPDWCEDKFEIAIEDNGERWLNEEVSDQISFYRKAIRKGLKYFRTYEPDKYDYDDEAYEKYMEEL